MNTDDTNRRQWARQAILLVITCVVLAAAMLLIRAYVFTIYSDSQTGERVIVNRIDRNDFSKGDKVVYTENGVPFMGYVSAVPGDTVTLQGNKYQIRPRCVCNGTEWWERHISYGDTLVDILRTGAMVSETLPSWRRDD